jgi:outer membrane autotransporter protein
MGRAYLAGAFAFAQHWMSTDRFAVGDHLTASFAAQSFGGRLEGGYRLTTSPIGIIPYAAVQSQHFHTPGFTEIDVTGGDVGPTFNAQSSTDTRAELGSRFDTFVALDQGALLALRCQLAWAHDWVTNLALLATLVLVPVTDIPFSPPPVQQSEGSRPSSGYRAAGGIDPNTLLP